ARRWRARRILNCRQIAYRPRPRPVAVDGAGVRAALGRFAIACLAERWTDPPRSSARFGVTHLGGRVLDLAYHLLAALLRQGAFAAVNNGRAQICTVKTAGSDKHLCDRAPS